MGSTQARRANFELGETTFRGGKDLKSTEFVTLKSTRFIHAHEELFIEYGGNFLCWNDNLRRIAKKKECGIGI